VFFSSHFLGNLPQLSEIVLARVEVSSFSLYRLNDHSGHRAFALPLLYQVFGDLEAVSLYEGNRYDATLVTG